MIPAPFEYHRPKSVAEAVKLLGKNKEARPLAGGHSLLPAMKLRLASPRALIDLGGIAALRGIKKVGDKIIIGAMTTQHELLASPLIAKHLPILSEAAKLIADPQVRYLGTIGGNVANGDPGNDMPAVMLALDASYRIAGKGKPRTLKARAFYKGVYQTALKPVEIITAIEVSIPGKHGFAYEKLKRKVGDYATAAAAVVVTVKGGKVASCAIALTNLAPIPMLAEEASNVLVGRAPIDAAIAEAAAAARKVMDPANDTRGTPEYRTATGGIMVARALKRGLAIA